MRDRSAPGTVRQSSACPLGYRPRGSDCNCAIDNRQSWLEQINVTRRLSYKIFNLKRVANMQDIHFADRLFRKHKIHPDSFVVF